MLAARIIDAPYDVFGIAAGASRNSAPDESVTVCMRRGSQGPAALQAAGWAQEHAREPSCRRNLRREPQRRGMQDAWLPPRSQARLSTFSTMRLEAPRFGKSIDAASQSGPWGRHFRSRRGGCQFERAREAHRWFGHL